MKKEAFKSNSEIIDQATAPCWPDEFARTEHDSEFHVLKTENQDGRILKRVEGVLYS